MAKEFKHFDKKYAHLAGTALKAIEAFYGSIAHSDVEAIDCWPYITRYETVDHAKVAWAVYESPGAEEWQKFRVSLKGLSTKEKLYCLGDYWDRHIAPGASAYPHKDDWNLQIIRVNNYIGALIRGGQLDSNLNVQRN